MKKLIKLFAILTLVLLLPMTVMAESGEIDNNPVDSANNQTTEVEDNTVTASDLSNQGTPINVDNFMNTQNINLNSGDTLDTLGNKIIAKLYQVALLLQKAAVPIALGMFILGGIMIVFGSLTKKGVTGGAVVCILAIASYVICIYAPNIIQSVSQWLVQ